MYRPWRRNALRELGRGSPPPGCFGESNTKRETERTERTQSHHNGHGHVEPSSLESQDDLRLPALQGNDLVAVKKRMWASPCWNFDDCKRIQDFCGVGQKNHIKNISRLVTLWCGSPFRINDAPLQASEDSCGYWLVFEIIGRQMDTES